MAGLTAVAFSALVVVHPQPLAWEIAFTRWVQQWTLLYLPLAAVSWPGNSVAIQGLGLVLICWLLARHGWRREARTLAWVGVGVFLLNLGLKALVGRPRPTAEVVTLYAAAHGWSFPSGHVMFYTAFYGGLVGFAGGKLSPGISRTVIMALGALLVGLVGWSRIFLGAHWLTDVIAGYGFGIVWLLLIGRPLWRPSLLETRPATASPDHSPSKP
ncbi:MAG: phosphatase PAP2 family protein [Chloracidobacterium sp.]